MGPADLPVTAMFEDLVSQGLIKPTTHMEDLVFPGALAPVPSVIGYATPDIPIRGEMAAHAELGKRFKGNFYGTGD